ncbi:MAG: DMT family transporter [Pseudomonadota bacterium]
MLNKTIRAILYSLVALFLFDCMALVIKFLSARYTTAELTAWRNLLGLVPALVALYASPTWRVQATKWRLRQWKLALGRGVILSVAQFSLYMSLGILNFATATTITYANALFMTALAVPFLGERVGIARWLAVVVGFIGVILIVGPGQDAFSPAALLPLLAAAMYALAGVTARMMDEEVPTALINFYATGAATICTFALVPLTGGFSSLASIADLWWICAMGLFGGTAVLVLIIAYRMTEQSNLAPFSYFGIPIAFALGYIFFEEAPFGELFPGALLIAAGGLMIVWRERRLRPAVTSRA